jgi:hypothetical protein
MSRDQCLLRYGRCSCDLCSRCSKWFPCISTQLSAHRRTEVHALSKIPGFTPISWQALSTRCSNTSKWLIGAECTKVLQPEIERITFRWSCRQVDWASTFYPLFSICLVQVLSDNAEKMSWCLISQRGVREFCGNSRENFEIVGRYLWQIYWSTLWTRSSLQRAGRPLRSSPWIFFNHLCGLYTIVLQFLQSLHFGRERPHIIHDGVTQHSRF